MNIIRPKPLQPGLRLRWLVVMLLSVMAVLCLANAQDAASLKAHYVALQNRLSNNPFGMPLYLESAQTSGKLKGDIYSVVEYPFPMVEQALQSLDHWCDILILHLNIKECRTKAGPKGDKLILSVGRKFDQPSKDTYKLEFGFSVADSADYLEINLIAGEGPFGTKNYEIRLQATRIDSHRSFIHMSYSYNYGFAARMAMKAYLGTIGLNKVGFSFTECRQDGRPAYIGGVLGLVERNTMRYYLAIDSYLGAYKLPQAEQTERRLTAWYAATERFAPQLHEMKHGEYMDMKRKEIHRQRGPR